jgi:D-amino-acid dehydrogenase
MNSTQRGEGAIIVGAGIIGIACAHYLSKAGMPVTVIDRGPIAGACSHGNCGYICPSHVLPLTEPSAIAVALKSLFTPGAPFRVKPRLSPALWNWMWQFARRCHHQQMLTAGRHLKAILDSSMAEYRGLIEEERLDCEWKRDGLLYVLRTGRGMREFAETDRFLSDHFGVAARRIEGGDLPTFDSALKPGLAGAFHYEGDASVRPERLSSTWSERLKERGVTFLEHCELRGIRKSAGRVTHLETARGEMSADVLVFATGAWSPRLSRELGCRIPVQPGKGYSVTMPAPDPCPRHPMLFPEHRVGVSPFENGYRLGSMMEFAGFDATIPERRIQQLRDSARPYLVAPFTEGDQRTWYGWRPMTWDSLPIIGRVAGLANAYLATGHNMLGMSLATATGRLIAEMIQDRPLHIDPTPYCPSRF